MSKTARQLAIIAELVSICDSAAIECWLRGSWAVDFNLGRVTRDHEDIDAFAWATDSSRLARDLVQAGFREESGPPPSRQRNFVKHGEEFHISFLERLESGQVVTPGTDWDPWPEGMLDGPPGRLGGIECRITSPGAQIYIKQKWQEWRPDLPPRQNDRADIDLLERGP